MLIRVTDHSERRVCCDERTDGANERKGSEQLLWPFAAGGEWRRVRSCQTTAMTSGAAADAVGRAAVLPWHQVRLCTVALDTAVAKAGKQYPRNVAGHILCWHLVMIRHTHCVRSSAGEREWPAHISDPLFHCCGMELCLHPGFPQLSKEHRPPHRSIKQMRQKMREYPTSPSFTLRRFKAHKHKLFGGCINFYANTASFPHMMIAYWHLFRFVIARTGLYTIAIHYGLILEPDFPPGLVG